jgi:hypothetical protein
MKGFVRRDSCRKHCVSASEMPIFYADDILSDKGQTIWSLIAIKNCCITTFELLASLTGLFMRKDSGSGRTLPN